MKSVVRYSHSDSGVFHPRIKSIVIVFRKQDESSYQVNSSSDTPVCDESFPTTRNFD